MRFARTGVLFLAFLGFANVSRAELFKLDIEPVIGYERVQQELPTQHTTNRLIYGGRITAGVLLVALEAEYTRGTSEEILPDLTVKSTGDKIKAGLRSGFNLGSLLQLYLRGGLQGSQETTEQTQNGVTTTTVRPIAYNPYAGAGLRMRLTSRLTASASVIAVIPDITNLGRNEYQTTAGFAVKLP